MFASIKQSLHYRKLEITVLGARPMNEVGFRDLQATIETKPTTKPDASVSMLICWSLAALFMRVGKVLLCLCVFSVMWPIYASLMRDWSSTTALIDSRWKYFRRLKFGAVHRMIVNRAMNTHYICYAIHCTPYSLLEYPSHVMRLPNVSWQASSFWKFSCGLVRVRTKSPSHHEAHFLAHTMIARRVWDSNPDCHGWDPSFLPLS